MLISKIMTRSLFVASPEMTLGEARAIMEREEIGYLPVLNRNSDLVGIVARSDIFKANPSMEASPGASEAGYLLGRLSVEKAMVKNVITVQVDEVVEKAARIMADRAIGCLPIMSGLTLAGIITETDIFRFFVGAFGARHKGTRITINARERPGQIATLVNAIAKEGGNIVAVVTSEGDDASRRRMTLKITGLSLAAVEAAAGKLDDAEIEDIRE